LNAINFIVMNVLMKISEFDWEDKKKIDRI
jgi:hypothetical protein